MELTQANTEALIQLRGITSISYFGITRAIYIDCIHDRFTIKRTGFWSHRTELSICKVLGSTTSFIFEPLLFL